MLLNHLALTVVEQGVENDVPGDRKIRKYKLIYKGKGGQKSERPKDGRITSCDFNFPLSPCFYSMVLDNGDIDLDLTLRIRNM